MRDVIGFYPGGGGNRYARSIRNEEYSTDNITYDRLLNNQHFENRYLLAQFVETSDLILTHCLNPSRIKQFIPDCNITFLVSDFKKSLHREWVLEGLSRYKPNDIEINVRIEHYNAIKSDTWPDIMHENEFTLLPDNIKQEVDESFAKVNELSNNSKYQQLLSAFATIRWHHAYYTQYPVDFEDTIIIDIDIDNSEFAQVMRKQLNVEIHPVFELAWQSFKTHGSTAALTEIYEQYQK